MKPSERVGVYICHCGTNIAGMVDVEDVARGHILAAQKGKIGERYILGNENVSLKDFFQMIGEIGGVEPPKMKLPMPVALVFGHVYQLLSKVTGKPPVLTPSMIKMGGSYAYFDCSKAANELGIPQTPVRETLEKAINWFKENGYIKAK